MTIYSLLIDDHKKVEKLFKEIESLKKANEEKKESKEIEKLFNSIFMELKIHRKAEEKEFYNFLANTKEMQSLILECKEEHSIFDKLLEELKEGSQYNAKWFAKLHELKEIVEHHVSEEEGKLFQKAKKILNKDDEKEIGENFLKSKDELKQQIHM